MQRCERPRSSSVLYSCEMRPGHSGWSGGGRGGACFQQAARKPEAGGAAMRSRPRGAHSASSCPPSPLRRCSVMTWSYSRPTRMSWAWVGGSGAVSAGGTGGAQWRAHAPVGAAAQPCHGPERGPPALWADAVFRLPRTGSPSTPDRPTLVAGGGGAVLAPFCLLGSDTLAPPPPPGQGLPCWPPGRSGPG